jgi:DNA-binding Lrp family transcriptional regulator
VDAFVYLRAVPGKVEDVVTQLLGAKGVRHAVTVVGDWDVLAAVHGPDLNAIAFDVLRTVHRIDGVERTLTTPVVPAHVSGVAGGGLAIAAPMHRTGEACYVRIGTEPGTTAHVFELLAEMEEVAGVALVGGEHDILAEIPYGWEEAARVVLERIQRLHGVVSTNTLVAVPTLPAEDDDRDQFSAWT